jgi:hypothetical protein
LSKKIHLKHQFHIFTYQFLLVYLEKDDVPFKKLLSAKIGAQFIEFHIKDTPNLETIARTDKIRPLKSGLSIISPSKGYCTGAFSAYSLSGGVKTPYYITAGHCGTVGETIQQGGEGIGTVVQKYLQEFGTADAIKISVDSLIVSDKIYDRADFEAVEQTNDEIVGQTICKSGYSTDLTCGTLYANNWSGYLIDGSSSYWNTNMRWAKLYAAGGDSGAAAFKGNPNFGYSTAVGVLSASNGVDTIYSHISNVLSNLGLTNIYTETDFPG